MINLLPDDYKKELRAARTNVMLFRYNIMTLAAIGFLVLSCGIFYVILTENKRSAEESNSANIAKANSYQDTKKQADEYRTNLLTAKQILANEVNYTDVIFGVTQLLPTGVVLDNLNLNSKDFGNQTIIAAHAKSYEAATKLKQNFENSKLFSNVYFQTINNSAGDSTNKDYPISVNVSVKINKVAQ
jgi:Tfp pilus assembly protein PilN